MTPPGWYPNPDGSDSTRYWDGQQWTVVATKDSPATPQPTLAERTPATPEQAKSNRKWLIGAGAFLAVLIVASIAINSGDDGDATDTAATASMQAARSVATLPSAPSAAAAPAAKSPARTGPPPPAQTATEAGCEEPDPSIVSAIETSLTEGRTLDQVAAVNTLVNGVEYTYTAGNVYKADGDRSVSGVVWITPGFGVMGLSGNSRTVSTLPFGRSVVDANAGDEYGVKVTDCVTALALGS